GLEPLPRSPQSVLEIDPWLPIQLIAGTTDVQYDGWYIEAPTCCVSHLHGSPGNVANCFYQLIQRCAGAAADIEYAVGESGTCPQSQSARDILDMDVIAHDRSVPPDLDRLVRRDGAQKRRHGALSPLRVLP